MDLFVEAIDSRLQPAEKYRKLLESRKKTKNGGGSKKVGKGKAEKAGEVAKEEPEDPQKEAESAASKALHDSDKSSPHDDREPVPFLNNLINLCTGVVRATNEIPGHEYRSLRETEAGAQKLEGIKAKCRQAMETIEAAVRKMAKDHVFDGSSDALGVLFDEIDAGLKKHNRTKYGRHSAELDETLDADPPSSRSDRSKRSASSQVDLSSLMPVNISKKKLTTLEKGLLTSYSISLDVAKYSLGPRPQDDWSHLIDNFASVTNRVPAPVKHNMIEPQIRFAKDPKHAKFFENEFVPKIYPKPEFLHSAGGNELPGSHLYAQEINSLVWSEESLESTHQGYSILGPEGGLLKVTEPEPLADLSYKMVTTATEFDEMLETISKCRILSIDLEHHDVNTYRGFVCLIQLSTQRQDYIVDPFKIFPHINKLNRVTTDPRILKVMHGAGNDVVWLQRDFGVYVVNLFDTREAAKVLGLNEQSLAKLIGKYFSISLNKVYQLADWSVRPLNTDMLNYACSDSHYLIPLYVKMKNNILAKSDGRVKIIQVMNNSRSICLKQFADKGIELYNKFKSICRRNKMQFTSLDFVTYNFFLNLIAFRNYAARKLDISEQSIVRDYKISIIIKRMKSASERQLASYLSDFLQPIKHEIPKLVKIKNTIEYIHAKIQKMNLILIRPRSMQFILGCLEGKSTTKPNADEFEKLLDLEALPRAESQAEKSTVQKRSLSQEDGTPDDWKRRKFNV